MRVHGTHQTLLYFLISFEFWQGVGKFDAYVTASPCHLPQRGRLSNSLKPPVLPAVFLFMDIPLLPAA